MSSVCGEDNGAVTNMICITGRTADEVWLAAARSLRDPGSTTVDLESRGGPTSECLHVALCLENPLERWVPSRIPAINPAFAIAEVFWILAGRDDAAFLTAWNSALPKFVGPEPILHGAYGARLRRSFGVDQLAAAYDALRQNRSTRQVVLQIWSAADDLPLGTGAPRSQDIPCNVCASLKIRDGRLFWLQVMRSNDLVRGLPYNFVQFTTLQEVMAGWLGVGVGEYMHVADSLHVYRADLEGGIDTIHESGEQNSDTLAIPRDEFESVLPTMVNGIAICADRGTRVTDLHSLIRSVPVPNGYRNLLSVVAAEAARRRRWHEDAHSLIELCANPILAVLWRRWNRRFAVLESEQ